MTKNELKTVEVTSYLMTKDSNTEAKHMPAIVLWTKFFSIWIPPTIMLRYFLRDA